jgi:hypothetical protein
VKPSKWQINHRAKLANRNADKRNVSATRHPRVTYALVIAGCALLITEILPNEKDIGLKAMQICLTQPYRNDRTTGGVNTGGTADVSPPYFGAGK